MSVRNVLGRFELLREVQDVSVRASLRNAQLSAMTRQLPLLYIILGVSSDLLGGSFVGRAPWALCVGVPAMLTLSFAWRGRLWWGMRHRRDFPPEEATRLLAGVIRLSLLLGLGCSAWALALGGYGADAARMHVAFYMSVTVIGCICCLACVPLGAITLTAAVALPLFLGFLLYGGDHVGPVLVNAALVFAALLVLLATQYRAFVELIVSRETMLAAQREAHALHEENLRLANLDQLTGLPNRRIFFETLASRLGRGERAAVALVDLDGFKPVNDAFGHAAGDEVLKAAAARLARFAEPGQVARLGGDEFAVIVTGLADRASLLEWGRRVSAELSGPYPLSAATAWLSGSIGLSSFADDVAGGERLLEEADYALYSVKQGGRGEAALFTGEHERALRRLASVGQALRGDRLEAELSLAYQPLVDSHTAAPTGFEALARWRSATLGQVSPQEFIEVAEREGLVSRLTLILLRRALDEAAAWPAPLRLSFNLSAGDLMNPSAMEAIRTLVREGPLPADRLDFEVTETALISSFERAAASLESLRALGCGLSLDDFGVGRSSLSYVDRLPLDKVKIDRSFVAKICDGGSTSGVVGAIVAMCASLRLGCVVEGVETREQMLRLRQIGCRHMQGYLFGRPMPAQDVAPFLAGGRSPQARQA